MLSSLQTQIEKFPQLGQGSALGPERVQGDWSALSSGLLSLHFYFSLSLRGTSSSYLQAGWESPRATGLSAPTVLQALASLSVEGCGWRKVLKLDLRKVGIVGQAVQGEWGCRRLVC